MSQNTPRPSAKERSSRLRRLLCCSSSSTPVLSPIDAQPAQSLSQALVNGNAIVKGSDVPSSTSRPYFIPFEVPLLPTKTPYDNHPEGFWDFPERAGWILDGKQEHRKFPQVTDLDSDWLRKAKELDAKYKCRQRSLPKDTVAKRPRDSLSLKCFRTDGSDASLSEEVAFQQAWLFFGVLAELSAITGVPRDSKSDFLAGAQAGSERRTISTSAFNDLPHQWLEALNPRSATGDQEGRWTRMLQIIQHVMSLQTIISTEKSEIDEPQFLTYEECKALLSIRILFRAILLTLTLSAPSLSKDLSVLQPFTHPALAQSFPANCDELKDFAIDEMLIKGWCKSECKLLEPFDGAYNFFATRLNSGRWIMDHGSCNDWRCLADQVDEKTYQTVHAEKNCRCSIVRVKPDELCAILDKRKVPKILLSKDLKPAVVSDNHPYVAISHVWSHGLGNPKENALPICQIRRLAGYVSALQKPGEPNLALWMDTLCIPVRDDMKKHRNIAIDLMGQTYGDAFSVLVLDRELQRLDGQKVSALEEDMLTAFIGWTRRLWTLQEASLSKRLHIQTSRGPHELDKTKPKVSNQEQLLSSICFRDHIQTLIRDRIPPMDTLRKSVFEKSDTVSVTTTALQRLSFAIKHRSTSKMEDEAIILAITLGLDKTGIQKESNVDGKMAKFLTAIHDIPSDIIFGNWEKIRQAPYRWAPRSLLNFPIFNLQSFGLPAICSADGLHAQYQGFLFEDAVGTHDGDKYYIVDQGSETKYKFEPRENSSGLRVPETPALIFRPFAIGGDTAVTNVLRRSSEEGKDVIEVTIVGYLRMVASGVGLDIGENIPLKGRLTGEDQRWLVT